MAVAGKRKRDATEVVNEIATEFHCSITTSLIVEPVTTVDGQLYEKAAIAEWLSTHNTSPNTGKRLASKVLTPAPHVIRSAIERLVRSDALAPEETRTWRTKKAAVLIAEGSVDEAKELLRDAKEAGDATAGFLLGKLLMDEGRKLVDEAAAAGVAEAAEYLQSLTADSGAPAVAAAHGPPLRSVSDVQNGQFVIVLPSAELASILRDWNEEKASFVGQKCKIIRKDGSDDTLALLPAAGFYIGLTAVQLLDKSRWFPVAACAKPSS